MGLRDYIPFTREPVERRTTLEARPLLIDKDSQKAVVKLFKSSALAMGFTGLSSLTSRTNFETAPYDFDRINRAADTDSYIRQGLTKYRELMWKEGWDIVSENDESADYIRQRIDFMEFAMKQPFQDFLNDVGDQLIKFGNAFIAKSRGDLAPYFPGQIKSQVRAYPVVGYYLIPAETVEIQRTKNNKVISYRQRLDTLTEVYGQNKQPKWQADEVIHLALDKKPGRAFGTPFLISVLDDVLSLRQIEEDILNLIHKELFPLYKYKVGTPEMPAEQEEITQAIYELENLRNDGGLILPERHDVEVIGADSNSLDASDYLSHFVNRVVVGLGLSPHHLGIMNEGGNRSVTDRLDVALYDKIKTIQRYVADMIRLGIFNELLMEGGYDPFVNPKNKGISDRCDFRFREIDVDTQVKKENHVIQKWLSDGLTWEEYRTELGEDTDVDENRLFSKMQSATQTDAQIEVMKAQPAPAGESKQPANKKKTAQRTADNKSRPKNQHGRRSSPNIRHNDEIWLSEVADILDEGYTEE